MKKIIAVIATKFQAIGGRQVSAAMESIAQSADKTAKSTAKLDGGSLASITGSAGAAADRLDAVRQEALAAKKALDQINGVKLKGGRNLDIGQASGKDAAASASAFSDAFRTHASSLDVSGIDEGVRKRAIEAFRSSRGRGVELEVYVDKSSLVRLERDVLEALDIQTPTIDVAKIDKGAARRAGEAYARAMASGIQLDRYVDEQTRTVFDERAIRDVVAELGRAGGAFSDVAENAHEAVDAVEDLADETRQVARETKKLDSKKVTKLAEGARDGSTRFGALRSAAAGTAAAIAKVGTAGASMGKTLTGALKQSTGLLKGLAASAGALAASKGLSAGGAAAFGLKSANDTVDTYKQARNISALTGMTVQETEFWQRYGAQVGLADNTDLGQVFSGFVAARREAADGGNANAAIFEELGIGKGGSKGGPNASIISDSSSVSALFPGIAAGAKDAAGAIAKTNDVFVEFLQAVNKLSKERRSFILTQVFGEDDALKVAELADAVAQTGDIKKAMRDQAGTLVTDQELAQIKRYQAATLRLGTAWDFFKRRLFAALEPILTGYARFFEGVIFANAGAVIERYFVRPFIRLTSLAIRLDRFLRGDSWAAFRRQATNTGKILGAVITTMIELAQLAANGFLPSAGTSESRYLRVLLAIDRTLIRFRTWIRTDGPAAVKWLKGFGAQLFALAVAGWAFFGRLASGVAELGYSIASMLDRSGIDWRRLLTIEGLVSAGQQVIAYFAALFRDLSRLWDGDAGFLETGLARAAVGAAASAQAAIDGILASIRAYAAGILTSVGEFFAPLTDYLKLAWSEFQASLTKGGPDLDEMKTRLGQLLRVIYDVGAYIVDLARAIRMVAIEGKRAPEGFEWLQTVYDIVGRVTGAIGTLFNAIKPVLSSLDAALAKMGLWNTATILLAGIIAAKIGGALAGVIGTARTLLGLLGLGGGAAAAGAAAGTGAAAGGAAAAAGGAASGAAAGGILGGITAIGVRLAAVLTQFGPIGALVVGYVTAVTAASYQALQWLDELTGWIDKVGGMVDLKTKSDVDVDVAAVRAQMNADYDRYGGKSGAPTSSPEAASGGAYAVDRSYTLNDVGARSALGGTASAAAIYAVSRAIGSERKAGPKSTVIVNIGGESLQFTGTDREIAGLQRAAARSLGR